MERAFITGIAGFAGSHLAEHLRDKGWEVLGAEKSGVSLAHLEKVMGFIRVEECDIHRSEQVAAALANAKPDVVFHLAAVTFVPSAENASQKTLEVNVSGTLNVLEGCRGHAPAAQVILISSSEVYGKAPQEEMPLREDRVPAPANFYALTKLCAEELGRFYQRSHSLPVVILRPFNHIGPGQSPNFVTSSFARQIAEIEAGKREPVLSVGNLDAARDFTDVRDIVRAYSLAAERCRAGETYNVCSGRPHLVKELLDKLLDLTTARIEVRQDPHRLRKSDVPLFYGDYSKFRHAADWAPEREITSTLKDILDYWRGRV